MSYTTDEISLAEELHKYFCTRNHIDMCDWTYHGWDTMGFEKKAWVKQARVLIEKYGYEGALRKIDEHRVMARKLDKLTKELHYSRW